MLVEVKEWESLDKKGHPRAQIFQRLVYGGDVIDLPDTAVVHEVDSDIDKDASGKPKKEKFITHYAVRVSPNPNADPQDMTELEHRQHTIRTSPMARRWSKADKELFLKYYWYTPDWMKPANRGAQPTVDPEDSMPSKWGRDIPTTAPGQTSSLGFDTGEYVGKIAGLTTEEAVKHINKTQNPDRLHAWMEEEKRTQAPREKVLNSIDAQLKTSAKA